MKKTAALLRLLFNFNKGVLLSGWVTACVILRAPARVRPGLVRMPYSGLSDTAANFLGALITLSPGTTTVEIDLAQREYLLHLLDLDHAEASLAAIQRDFVVPLRVLSGEP